MAHISMILWETTWAARLRSILGLRHSLGWTLAYARHESCAGNHGLQVR